MNYMRAQFFFLKITIYCVQKLWTVHQTAVTPSPSQAHSMPHQGNRDCYGAIEHQIIGNVLGNQEKFFFYEHRSIRSKFVLLTPHIQYLPLGVYCEIKPLGSVL